MPSTKELRRTARWQVQANYSPLEEKHDFCWPKCQQSPCQCNDVQWFLHCDCAERTLFSARLHTVAISSRKKSYCILWFKKNMFKKLNTFFHLRRSTDAKWCPCRDTRTLKAMRRVKTFGLCEAARPLPYARGVAEWKTKTKDYESVRVVRLSKKIFEVPVCRMM